MLNFIPRLGNIIRIRVYDDTLIFFDNNRLFSRRFRLHRVNRNGLYQINVKYGTSYLPVKRKIDLSVAHIILNVSK